MRQKIEHDRLQIKHEKLLEGCKPLRAAGPVVAMFGSMFVGGTLLVMALADSPVAITSE
jgi:hypothetical protein